MRLRNVVVLVAIAVLVSLGATQMADAAVPTVPVNITIGHDGFGDKAKIGDTVVIVFDTEEDYSVTGTIAGRDANFELSGTIGSLDLLLNGSETPSLLTFSFVLTNNDGSTLPQTAVRGTGADTSVTTDFTPPPVPTNISIESDNDDTSRAELGDIVTVSFDTEEDSFVEGTIAGRDAKFELDGTDGTLTLTLNGSEPEDVPLTFKFNQTDATGNDALPQTAVKGTGATTSVIADFTPPAVPDNISIKSNNDDPTKAKSGDVVTVSFDTEEDSFVDGTIAGRDAKFELDGTLTLTLNGSEPEDVPLTFKFNQTDATGNKAVTQTVVIGTGLGTFVTTDFTPPPVPTNISIESDNDDTSRAELGDIVTVSFDTEEDSFVEGTIAGRDAKFELDGTDGTLTLTLNGSEPEDVPLTFKFNQTDATGNKAVTQTDVTGLGTGYSVIADFTPPAVPTNISITSSNADSTKAKSGDIVTVTFDTENGYFVDGTIDGFPATPNVSGTVGTLTITLGDTVTQNTPLTFEFTVLDTFDDYGAIQTKVTGTGLETFVIADFTLPAVPDNISIKSNNADPTKAKIGDIVTVTFDTDAGSSVEGTIDGKPAKFELDGTAGSLTRTLDGNELEFFPLSFKFNQTDATGNKAVTQTVVIGTGLGTFVTTDFTPPPVPTNISIESDNADSTKAKIGNLVTVSFDIEKKDGSFDTGGGSFVTGFIDDEFARSNVFASSGFLDLILSGDETRDTPLTFEFTLSDATGNKAVTQTAVKGTGATTSVIADFTPLTVPTNISIISSNADSSKAKSGDVVTVSFDTEEDYSVEGTIDGKTAKFELDGTAGTLTITVDDTVTEDTPLTFEFTQTDYLSNDGVTQTAVKGTGATTSVIADFTLPAVPDNISIKSNNADPTKAKIGDVVTVSFDIEEGSTAEGRIDDSFSHRLISNGVGTFGLILDGNETIGSPLTFEFTITDAAGNVGVTQTAVTGDGLGTSVTIYYIPPAALTNISITSDNDDSTKAKIGDVVTVSFDIEEGSTAEGRIDGKDTEFDLSGTRGILKLTLDSTVTENVPLTFSFVVTDTSGALGVPQTVVTGTGADTSVTTDFTPPTVPSDIFLSHDGAVDVYAQIGDLVIITFVTEEGSSVKGTIAGRDANFELSGTAGSLDLILDGTEPQGSPLTFEFTQTDATGNKAVTQTVVIGTGLETSVIAAFTPIITSLPAFVNLTPTSLVGTALSESTVELFNGEMSVDTVTADDSGSFTFTTVALNDDDNIFTVIASNIDGYTSEKSDPVNIILDTISPTFDSTYTSTNVLVGNTIPILTCTDPNSGYAAVTDNAGGTTFDAEETKIVTYTCIDAAGNTKISIISYNVASVPSPDTTLSGHVFQSGTMLPGPFGGLTNFFTPGTSTTAVYSTSSDVFTFTIISGSFTPYSNPVIFAIQDGEVVSFSTSPVKIDDAFIFTIPNTGFDLTKELEFRAEYVLGGSSQGKYYAGTIFTVDQLPIPTDMTPPVITLTGTISQSIELGDGYTELGATTDDDSVVTIDTTSFKDAVGSYDILYNSVDAAGNHADQVIRTVMVVDTMLPSDTTPPVITLTGTISQSIELGDGYTELGATTDDDSVVTIDTTSFKDAVGSYDILYNSVDAAGNHADQVIRTVMVVDTMLPSDTTVTSSTPTITTLPTTVTTSTITIEGTADALDTILLRNNGIFVITAFADISGDFIFTNVPLNLGANSFTVQASALEKDTSYYSDSVVITFDTTNTLEIKKSNDDWARAPTFGSNHLTYQSQVDYGFTFNTQKVMIQNNYYTDIDTIHAAVGNNTATIKVFAQDPLRTVSLNLGLPTKTYAGDAEVKIELIVSQNNTAASGYSLKQINYHQDEELVDESNTSVTINKVRCNDTDSMKNCHSFTVSFNVMNSLMYDYTAISAYDVSGRSQTTFINDGIVFGDEQISEPKTHTILYRLTNQPGILSYDLTQTDVLNNIWEDQHGSMWTYNLFDTWKQIS